MSKARTLAEIQTVTPTVHRLICHLCGHTELLETIDEDGMCAVMDRHLSKCYREEA